MQCNVTKMKRMKRSFNFPRDYRDQTTTMKIQKVKMKLRKDRKMFKFHCCASKDTVGIFLMIFAHLKRSMHFFSQEIV